MKNLFLSACLLAHTVASSQSLNYQDYANDAESFVTAVHQATVVVSSYQQGNIKISCLKNGTQPGLYLGNGQWEKYPEPSYELKKLLNEKIAPPPEWSQCPSDTIPSILPEVSFFKQSGGLQKYNQKFIRSEYKSIPTRESPRQVVGDGFNHEWAVAMMSQNLIAAETTLDVWRPNVPNLSAQSLSQFWVIGENGQQHQGIEVGWQVLPSVYGNSFDPHFFIYVRTGSNSGCLNFACTTQYIQAPGAIPPGMTLPWSNVNGSRVEATIGTIRDPANGNWYIFNKDGVGNYIMLGTIPANVYAGGPLATAATRFDVGGEISHTPGINTANMQMGTGLAFNTNAATSAMHKNIKYMNLQGSIFSFSGTSYSSAPDCYRASLGNNSTFGAHLFFGGFGGQFNGTTPPSNNRPAC